MKKLFSFVLILMFLFLLVFSIEVNAADLNTLTISTSKATVHPGDNINVNFNFGQPLGSYTFEIAYDNNLFEYVSSTNVTTGTDTGTSVIAYFFDTTGGSNPNSTMSVTFRAKTGITTSNPTDFSITATGLANPDTSVQFDDITVPIIKNVIVEPAYVNYDLSLNYTGTIMPNEEKDMTLVLSSPIGRYYDHVRIIADVTKPDGSNAQLLGTDSLSMEHDVLDSGWGDASGFGIGGAVNQSYALRGLFSHEGDYSITFKLIDRDASDAVISSKTVNFHVGEIVTPEPEQPEQPEQLPEELPKTGSNIIHIGISIISILIIIGSIILNKKHY